MNLTENQTRDLRQIFEKDRRVLLVYLFGSRARGEATVESDFDLAFLTTSSLSLDEQVDLNVRVMKTLKYDRIDFTFLREAPILLRYEVVSDGKLIYSTFRDEQVNSYELSIYREYYHTDRFRRLQREALKETFLK